MAEFKYYTRGGSSPQGKARVYYTAHPSDHDRCMKDIREDVFKRQNCAVFCVDPELRTDEIEDYELRLSQMQLLIVPVTAKLLTTSNRAIDTDIPFALAHHIPVLPLMQENGLDELFNQRVGNLQYLNKNDSEPTAISYDEKLTKFLDSIIVGDELTDRVRGEFCAYIFLSYRKKDRSTARRLMEQIHKNPNNKDIAIWYDEFLTPGEDFNDSILDALKKSDLFVLNVTPNIVNEENYIREHEYPTARELGRKILPVEMEPTDRAMLKAQYEGLPEPISPEELWAAAQLSGLAGSENNDSEHNYLIGLAYLNGIDVEVDHAKAVELITSSANAGYTEAIEKLVSMYVFGEGVAHDYNKGLEWTEKLIEIRGTRYDFDPTEQNAVDFLHALWGCAGAYDFQQGLNKAEKLYIEMLLNAESFYNRFCNSLFAQYISISCNGLAKLELERGNLQKAEEYARKGMEAAEIYADATGSAEARRDLIVNCFLFGEIAKAKGDLQNAKRHYQKGAEISAALAEQDGMTDARRDTAVLYGMLGDIARDEGDIRGAAHYYSESLEIFEQRLRENATNEAQRDYSIALVRFAELARRCGEIQTAEEYFLAALDIREELFKRAGTVIETRMDLSRLYSQLGDLAMAAGDLETAEKYYIQAIEVIEASALEIGTVQLLRDLSNRYFDLGNTAMRISAGRGSKDFSKAERYLMKALQIREDLAAETGTLKARRDLSTCYSKLGELYLMQGDFTRSEEYNRKALGIDEELARELGTPEAKRDLCLSYFRLGDVARYSGDRVSADSYYQKAFEICEYLVETLGIAESYNDLATAYYKLGELRSDIGYLEKAQDIWKKLSAKYPRVYTYRRFLEIVTDEIERLTGGGGLSFFNRFKKD